MVEMNGSYQGEKHCEIIHQPSGNRIATDAPKDNNGRGESFSPTDLVAAALGSCMLTVMAIAAEKDGLDLRGSTFQVTKEMQSIPRKISKLSLFLKLPARVGLEDRMKLEQIALTCPVHRSLHPDILIPLTFSWDL